MHLSSASVKRGENDVEIKLRRGESIWILPDPGALDEASEDVSIEELDTSQWWCGEIVDCCVWRGNKDQEDVGYLRIAVSPQNLEIHRATDRAQRLCSGITQKNTRLAS